MTGETNGEDGLRSPHDLLLGVLIFYKEIRYLYEMKKCMVLILVCNVSNRSISFH